MNDRISLRVRLWILTLSLIFGITGTLAFAKERPLQQEICQESLSQLAWWGGLYPEYCLPGAMRLVDERKQEAVSEGDAERSVKICFKYLSFLNK